MNKEKIDALRNLKVTKEEALEWVNILEKECHVETPLPIVYLKENGCLEAYPYLDKEKKEQAFGILINDIVWPLTGQYANVDMFKACHLLKDMFFPSVSDLMQVRERMPFIKSTFAILRAHEVEADDFLDGVYWTSHMWSNKKEFVRKVYSVSDAVCYNYDPYRGKKAHLRGCKNFHK